MKLKVYSKKNVGFIVQNDVVNGFVLIKTSSFESKYDFMAYIL